MKARAICLRIIFKIQLFSFITQPQRSCTLLQQHSLEIMGITDRWITKKKGLWCRWDRPPEGFYKLNVDGSSTVNGSTGGGIIRDHNGVSIVAFSTHYGMGTNNTAEFTALQEGLQLCREWTITNVMIESDSMLVTSAMRKWEIEHCNLIYHLRRCLGAMRQGDHIAHVYRQKNVCRR